MHRGVSERYGITAPGAGLGNDLHHAVTLQRAPTSQPKTTQEACSGAGTRLLMPWLPHWHSHHPHCLPRNIRKRVCLLSLCYRKHVFSCLADMLPRLLSAFSIAGPSMTGWAAQGLLCHCSLGRRYQEHAEQQRKREITVSPLPPRDEKTEKTFFTSSIDFLFFFYLLNTQENKSRLS